MKRILILMLALLLVLTGCSAPKTKKDADTGATEKPDPVELSLWTYPVGGWASASTVSAQISAFHKVHPEIRVSVHLLDYTTGDQEIEAAIEQNNAPDLVFEGPERLAANWGARGLMADLSDLWGSGAAGEIYPSVASACCSNDGAHYLYPLCMTTHCMAVNRDLFEAAGAWQYIDEATHTWTTDGFIAAMKALKAYGVEHIGAIYCGGQGGDQGTRALITNLYSGSFTDPAHTRYTFNSPENIRALELLSSLEGITFAPDMTGTDEQNLFCQGELAVSFCWNVASEVTHTMSNPDLDFDIFPMAFPTDDGNCNLQGGIWGFGIFDHQDEQRLEAAKTFIRFMTENDNQYTQAVLSSSFWPVRDVPNIYENDDLMTEYFTFRQYMGDYYQVTPGWANARTAWWNMLKDIGSGKNIADAAADFETKANAAANAK